MRMRMLPAAAVLVAWPWVAAAEPVTLTVLYHAPKVLRAAHEEIARRFNDGHADIKVRLLAPPETYEELAQRTLRDGIAGEAPDVVFHGLNRVRIFVDRKLAVPLDPFIKAEPTWDEMGYLPSMVALARFDGATYGLPFSISTPIVYYNEELVREALGVDAPVPTTWPEFVALGRQVQARDPSVTGIHFDYTISGNWMFLALIQSYGGRVLSEDETKVAFSGPAGIYALETLRRFRDGGMQDLSSAQARQAFSAGKIVVYSSSTAGLGGILKEVAGRFTVKTAPFPRPNADGTLPAGGNVAVMFTQDVDEQRAAWEYIKFATGPVGQTIMVNHTGYMPGNRIPVDDPAMLGSFYEQSPNHMTSMRQMPFMTGWYAFPGEQALKITDVIQDHMQTVVNGGEPREVLSTMADDVQALLPR